MLDPIAEKSLHIRISQLNDLVSTAIDMLEEKGLIPDFKKKLYEVYTQRIQATYNLNGQAVIEKYNLEAKGD